MEPRCVWCHNETKKNRRVWAEEENGDNKRYLCFRCVELAEMAMKNALEIENRAKHPHE